MTETNSDRRSDELHREIEQTREQLAETVQALVHKANVPARAKDRLHDTKDAVQLKVQHAADAAQLKVQHAAGSVRAHPIRLVAAALSVLALLVWLIRRGR